MHTLGQVFKCIHELAPYTVARQVSKVETGHAMSTRSQTQNKLAVPNVRLESCRKAFKYRGPCLLNLLDDTIATTEGWPNFKSALAASDMFQVV